MNTEIKIEANRETLTVLSGSAMPLREAQKIVIAGDIESVQRFLAKRYLDETKGKGLQEIDFEKSVILVDKENGTIQLLIDPENYYGSSVTAKLELSNEMGLFEINNGVMFTREQIIKTLRMNRIYFPDKGQHAALSAAFQKFSAKVYCDLEKESDTRGNLKTIFDRTVQSNVPLCFKVEMPIYKGQPKENFSVDILIEPQANGIVLFYFESVELAEMLEARKEEIFANQLQGLEAFPIINK